MLKKISSLVLALAVVVTSIAIMPLVIRAEVLKTEYYDLGLEYRNKTNDQVTIDSANATKKYVHGTRKCNR